MNKETFDKIKEALETRIIKCEQFLSGIEITDDLRKLTIERAQQLQSFCRREEAEMNKFVQNDLYHLIGMGELTPPQMMKLTFLTKDWLQYRSTIKALAMNFDKISQLPSIPVASAYKLKLCDLTLSSGASTLMPAVTGVPYAVSGNMIQVLKEDLPTFIVFWRKKTKTNFSENNFLQKVEAGAEYGGVRWTIDSYGNYVGIIKQDNVQQLFDSCAQENN